MLDDLSGRVQVAKAFKIRVDLAFDERVVAMTLFTHTFLSELLFSFPCLHRTFSSCHSLHALDSAKRNKFLSLATIPASLLSVLLVLSFQLRVMSCKLPAQLSQPSLGYS